MYERYTAIRYLHLDIDIVVNSWLDHLLGFVFIGKAVGYRRSRLP
jgi:hypothetical protein